MLRVKERIIFWLFLINSIDINADNAKSGRIIQVVNSGTAGDCEDDEDGD
jgi:hypothetical protein